LINLSLSKRMVEKWIERSLRVWKVGGSNPRSGQVKDWKIGTCCFPGSRSPFKARAEAG